jgi:hypothetical protein
MRFIIYVFEHVLYLILVWKSEFHIGFLIFIAQIANINNSINKIVENLYPLIVFYLFFTDNKILCRHGLEINVYTW